MLEINWDGNKGRNIKSEGIWFGVTEVEMIFFIGYIKLNNFKGGYKINSMFRKELRCVTNISESIVKHYAGINW